jgi:hypothetical protein
MQPSEMANIIESLRHRSDLEDTTIHAILLDIKYDEIEGLYSTKRELLEREYTKVRDREIERHEQHITAAFEKADESEIKPYLIWPNDAPNG